MSAIRKVEFDSQIRKATPAEVREICLREVAYTYETSETNGGRKWAFSQLRHGYEAGRELLHLLTLYGNHDIVGTVQKVRNQFTEDQLKAFVVLVSLRLKPEDRVEYKAESNKTVSRDMVFTGNRRAILSVDRYMEIGQSLLTATSYLSRILALSALTGRRTFEIACTATFRKVDRNKLLFSGQAKTRDREVDDYVIPCLCEADEAIKCLESIRRDKPELVEHPELFHNRCAKDLHKKANPLFREVFSDGTAKPKDLRSAYATICFTVIDEEKTGKAFYLAQILGHDPSIPDTALAYDDFIISDPNF